METALVPQEIDFLGCAPATSHSTVQLVTRFAPWRTAELVMGWSILSAMTSPGPASAKTTLRVIGREQPAASVNTATGERLARMRVTAVTTVHVMPCPATAAVMPLMDTSLAPHAASAKLGTLARRATSRTLRSHAWTAPSRDYQGHSWCKRTIL